MFDEKYKSLFEKLTVDEGHKEEIREKMKKELNEMNTNNKKNNRIYRYAAMAAVLLLTVTVLAKLLSGGNAANPIVEGENPTQETTVIYSELEFEESVLVEAPASENEVPGKIAPFTEALLVESSAVIKGTILGIRFKEYAFENESGSEETTPTRQTVIYEIKVDKIYYATDSFEVGETILIENDLYTYTSLAGVFEKLNINRQYILALQETEVYVEEGTETPESNLSVLYPFAPQIEITKSGQYLFPDHWSTLVTDDAKTVTMDMENAYSYYYGEMKLREDADFEKDFQKIVDTYCK